MEIGVQEICGKYLLKDKKKFRLLGTFLLKYTLNNITSSSLES
jgi:hypothetical protein